MVSQSRATRSDPKPLKWDNAIKLIQFVGSSPEPAPFVSSALLLLLVFFGAKVLIPGISQFLPCSVQAGLEQRPSPGTRGWQEGSPLCLA